MLLQKYLGDFSSQAFFDTYYLRLPLAQPGRARSLVEFGNWDFLARILQSQEVDAIVSRQGQRWQESAAPSLEQAHSLMGEGYTLCIRHAERHHAGLATVAQEFAEDLSAPIDIHVYCTPAGCAGLSWHYDVEEVFIFQTRGSKVWELRKNTVHPWPVLETIPQDMRHEREIMPVMCCELQPGDWLYIPSGYWHRTRANEESISLSVGVLAPSGVDFYDFCYDFLKSEILTSLRWRQRLPLHTVETDSTAGNERLSELRADFIQMLSAPDLVDAFWHLCRQQSEGE